MKKTLPVAILCCLILFASCTSPRLKDTLDDVATYIQQRPDSALVTLRAIDTTRLNSRAVRANFSLLHAMALDKNYIDTTDLGIIAPAVEYYVRRGSPLEKMQARFYQGRIYSNRQDPDRAMECYMLALEDSARVADAHYKDLVNSAISDIFSRNHNYEQELKYTAAALAYAKQARDSVGVWAITGHLAACYANMYMWEDAEKTFNEFFAMPVRDTLVYCQRQIQYAKSLTLKHDPNPKKALEIIQTIYATKPEVMGVEEFSIYAYVLDATGHRSEADAITSQLDNLGCSRDYRYNYWKYNINKNRHEYRAALGLLENSINVQDSMVVDALNQSLLRKQRDYFTAKSALQQQISENRLNELLAVTAFAALGIMILVLVLLFLRDRMRARLEEISSLYHEAINMLKSESMANSGYLKSLEDKDKIIAVLHSRFASIYRKQYAYLNDLCEAYLAPLRKDRRDHIYSQVSGIMKMFSDDAAAQRQLEDGINGELDNIVDKLRADLPGHTESDFRFLQYAIIGLEAKTISRIMGIAVDSVYTKKNRLKKEIISLESPYKDWYLTFLN